MQETRIFMTMLSAMFFLCARPPAENARIRRAILSGEERGACRAAAIENAAAAILAGERAKTYQEALALAAESVDSGRALAKLNALVAV